MKRNRLYSILFSLVLLVSACAGIVPAFAQDSSVTHESILAAIPDLPDLANQAPGTFVGEVEGSYAYIAFVVQGNLAIVYVCDGVGEWGWFKAEVVDGKIVVHDEATGISINAEVTADGISGTISLAVDDDGTAFTAHNFATVPAVPGKTGLARYADDDQVAGWIVTENGIRGIAKFRDCSKMAKRMADIQALMPMTSDASVKHDLAVEYTTIGTNMTNAGCGNSTTT